MNTEPIHRAPSLAAAAHLLVAARLPTDDLTEAHMEHFFYCGSPSAPVGLVGIELCGSDALLRSLAVSSANRSGGMGSALLARAEAHARAHGARALYLLTNTARHFFSHRGYSVAPRDSAPEAIRHTREFANICPTSAVLMVKRL